MWRSVAVCGDISISTSGSQVLSEGRGGLVFPGFSTRAAMDIQWIVKPPLAQVSRPGFGLVWGPSFFPRFFLGLRFKITR